jgi:integrase
MSLPEGVTFHKGAFLAQVSLGTDPVTGKRKRRQFTAPPCDSHAADGTVRTCRGCQQVARDLRAAKLTELRDNRYVEASVMTLGAWLDIFLEAHAGRRRKSTIAGYRKKVDRIIKPRIGHVRLQQLSGTQLEAFYGRLAEGDELRPQGYAPATIRQTHAIIRRALRDAVMPRGSYLTYNPAAELELPGNDDGAEDVVEVLRVWTSAQLRTFLKATATHRHATFFFLAAATGMRRSELCGLQWDMVDLDRGIIRVERGRHLIEGEVVWSRPKSTRSRRVIELSERQTAVLRSHRRAQAELRLAAGSAWVDTDLVFCDEDGTGGRPDSYTRSFHDAVARLDLPLIRLHDLRHTHATLLLEAGRPVKEVSERLGHSTTAFTMDVYGHVTDAMRSATAAALDEILGG